MGGLRSGVNPTRHDGDDRENPDFTQAMQTRGQAGLHEPAEDGELQAIGPADLTAAWREPKPDEHDEAGDECGPTSTGEPQRRKTPMAEHPQPVEEDIGENPRAQPRERDPGLML